MVISRRQLLEAYWTATTEKDKEMLKQVVEAVFSDMVPTVGWTLTLRGNPLFYIKAIHE